MGASSLLCLFRVVPKPFFSHATLGRRFMCDLIISVAGLLGLAIVASVRAQLGGGSRIEKFIDSNDNVRRSWRDIPTRYARR